MRNKAQIAKLEAKRATVAFPTTNSDFLGYEYAVLRALSDNGLSGFNWEWDAEEQAWIGFLRETAYVGGIRGSFKAKFKFHGDRPLAGEIERLLKEQAAFLSSCFATCRGTSEFKGVTS